MEGACPQDGWGSGMSWYLHVVSGGAAFQEAHARECSLVHHRGDGRRGAGAGPQAAGWAAWRAPGSRSEGL